MPYVKANFRTKALDVAAGALGANFRNWIQGSSVNFAGAGSTAAVLGYHPEGGGFLMGSFASQLSGVGYLLLSALDAITSAYGATWASNYWALPGSLGSAAIGVKYLPLGFLDFSGDGVSSPVFYGLSATQALAVDDSVAVVVVRKASQTTGSGIAFTSASNISVHFMYYGFVVSIADYFR